MYEVMKAKYVYTWEVVGDLQASNRDCFRMCELVVGCWPVHIICGCAAVPHGKFMNAHSVRPGRFNPVTAQQFEQEVSNWSTALLTLLSEVVQREQGGIVAEPRRAVPNAPPRGAQTMPTFDPLHPDRNPGPRSNNQWAKKVLKPLG